MEDIDFEFFLHRQGEKPSVVGARIGQSLRSHLPTTHGEAWFVFVGECTEALAEGVEVENGCDEHAPVDIDRMIEVLEVEQRRHVHLHPCRHITVDVHLAGKTTGRRFSPATTIGVVTAWARKKFEKCGLDAAAAAEYVLQISGTKIQPRSDEHLGELTKPGVCSLCFDLVVEVTPQG